jgi:uncharacterized repeat protein (TIGR03803 family)
LPEVKKYSQAAVMLAAAICGGSLLAQESPATTPVLTTLYSFTGASGAGPDGGLVSDASGALYGAAYAGGASDMGAVFQLTPPATTGGAWTEAVLYGFTGLNDGGTPFGSLVFDTKGALYGATIYGGTSNMGTVFQLTPPAVKGGAWTETVLYNFSGLSDGGNPTGSLVFDAKGELYGATTNGGTSGKGAVFQLAPPATAGNPWTYTVLYSFAGGSDGAAPGAGLTFGAGGVLYGTTYAGGASNAGTVFQLTPPAVAGGAWTESLLYSFRGGSDGGFPDGGLLLGKSGVLYGTTTYSGASNFGVVFQMTPPAVKGGAWTESVLYTFKNGKDGAYPFGDLLLSNKLLLGTTYSGGTGSGVLFELKPPAKTGGAWTETTLFTFTHGTTGANPYAGMAVGLNGLLYGTTFGGGTKRDGAVFSLAP